VTKKLEEKDEALPDLKGTKTGRGEYVLTFQNFYTAKGRSLSQALHDLANQLDAASMFGADQIGEEDEQIHKRSKPCKYCGAKIFFAVTENMKWMPIDGSTIFAPTLNQFSGDNSPHEDDSPYGSKHTTHCYSIFERSGNLAVRTVRRPQGQVWIAHQDVCGGKTPPADLGLRERWQRNHALSAKRSEELVESMKQTLRDLAA
jgi:hypothetical protein